MVELVDARRFELQPPEHGRMDFVFEGIQKLTFATNRLSWVLRVFCMGFGLVATLPGYGEETRAADPSNPIIAEYDGGTISLAELEDFAREMPLAQRIPFARRAGDWRTQMAGELAKSVELTSQAKVVGMQLDPGYLRARDYFTMEYLCYGVIRDRLTNRMDVSLDSQRREYETHKSDYWLSPTVSLRVIRIRSQDKMSSAVAALKSGSPFEQVELKYSEVSPRYRGRVVGPFPSLKERTQIPPPDDVIAAAMATPEGETTGPVKVGDYYFLTQVAEKTAGRQQTLEEVAEKVEERLRSDQNAVLLPALINQIQTELGAEVDEALFASSSPKANDQLATVGAFKLYRQEYTDLNGNVRGPAAPIAAMLPTRLKQFVLPYMMAEWAKVNHYLERKETQKALYYYDLQHLASRVAFDLADKIAPLPNEQELHAIFQKHIGEYRKRGLPEPRFEDYRDEILNAAIQEKAPERERRVSEAVLNKIHFKPVTTAQSKNITALEALAAAGDRLPDKARLLEMGPARIPVDNKGVTPYTEIGRAPSWRITYAGPGGGVSELTVDGPAPLLNSDDDYTSIGAFQKWAQLWRFDSDSLKRHAIDKSLGDFLAKHGNQVRAAATIEFSYSKDDPTSPTDCMIVYSATPIDGMAQDGVLMRYSARDGEVTKRRLGEPEGKCPTCPAPDLPARAIVNSQISSASSSTTPTLSGTGE